MQESLVLTKTFGWNWQQHPYIYRSGTKLVKQYLYTCKELNCYVITCNKWFYIFVLQLNSKISEYYKMLGLDGGFKLVCQPFSGAPDYSYLPYSCPKDAIQVGDLPKVSKSYSKKKMYVLLLRKTTGWDRVRLWMSCPVLGQKKLA